MSRLLGSFRRRFWGREPVGIEEGDEKGGEQALEELVREAGSWIGRTMGQVSLELEKMMPGSRSEPYLLAVLGMLLKFRKALALLMQLDEEEPLRAFGEILEGARATNLELRCKSALPRDAVLLADAVDAGLLTLERLLWRVTDPASPDE